MFDGIYLSWDPGMWKRHIDFHGYVHLITLKLVMTKYFTRMWKRGNNQDDEGKWLVTSSTE